MTIKKIYEKISECLNKLDNADIDDDAKLDLEILVIQLKKQLLLKAFDPLREINGVTIADVSKLEGLIKQIDQVIDDEKKRGETVKQVTAIAKIALKAAGLPIPS